MEAVKQAEQTYAASQQSIKDARQKNKAALEYRASIEKKFKELEDKIKEKGGTVVTTISKNTTILVAKDLSDLKTKGAKAEELGVKIMSLESFKKEFKL